tara:strand:- start:14533 stop:15597 length:1065 start_codon:yes stop_codon:yes gene_type:complete
MHVPVNRVFNNVSRNLGLKNYTNNLDSWSEWAFEAEQYIGSNKTFLQKELVFSQTPTQATAIIECTLDYSAPIDLKDEFIEINGTRYTFMSRFNADSVGNLVDSNEINLTNASITDTGILLSSLILNAVNTINQGGGAGDNINFENITGVRATRDNLTITITVETSGNRGNDYTVNTSNGFRIVQDFSGGKDKMHNKQIRLPENYVKVLSLRAGDTILQPTSSQYKSKVSSILDRYYIDGNRINFSTDYTSDVFVTVLAVPLSVEGYPMILQGHEEAVAHYIMWKHKLIGYYAGEVPQYIVKDLERRWYQLCGKVRGDDNMPSSIELLKIGKLWNAKVPVTSFNPPLYDGLNSY